MRKFILWLLFILTFVTSSAQVTNDFKKKVVLDWWVNNSVNVVLDDEPEQQAHSFTVSIRNETSETVGWNNPSIVPDGYLVVAKSGGEVDSYPVDGIAYIDNSIFGSGSQIGTGNFVVGDVASGGTLQLDVTGLTGGTVYHYRVMAYNGSGASINYRVLNEKGHLWAVESSPPTGMIGTDINASKTLEVRSGGTSIYYRARSSIDDPWGAWILWATIPGAEFHSLRCLEGGTIHNASGTPVLIKWMFNDHSGSAKVYAGYVPGDVPETVITGVNAQKWNEGAWNPLTSEYVAVSDDGTNRIATLVNARTVSYTLAMDGNSIASVGATSSPTIPFVICFKNAGTPARAVAALISGVWTLRVTPISKVFHMIKETPGLGGSATRMFCSSADDTGDDAIWSDDYFATFTSSAITGAYGSFAYDSETKRIALFSRTAGADIVISTDGISFESIDNPVANAVLFNGVSDGNGFNAQASSGSSLGIKTIASNIGNAETRFVDYTEYLDEISDLGGTDPTGTFIRDFAYYCRDNGLWDDLVFAYFANTQTSKVAVSVNLKNRAQKLIEVGTVTFSAGTVTSSGTSYYRTGQIPNTVFNLDNVAIIHRVQSNVDGTQWDYGATDVTGATDRTYFNSRTSNTIASSLHSSTSNATGSQTTSIGTYLNLRTGSTAADHDLYKDGIEWDGSNGTRTASPTVELYWLAHNSNGTAGLFSLRTQGFFVAFTNVTLSEAVAAYAYLITTMP